MFTTGQETILKECGVDGIILYYVGVPFNTISNFIPCLNDEQRYNPLWFRSHEDQPPLILLPCIAAGDLIEQVSLESIMLDLHQKQLRGEIKSDVLIHPNEDADLEIWLPSIKWFPNMGGLDEFINVANKYPWADFTLPSEYVASHLPKTEVLVRQYLADGGFDGNYSWAEKCASIRAWTLLEQSRLASVRAATLAKRTELNLDSQLWDGMDSSFFQRLIGLTTTHFGISTPIINEECQNKAFSILGNARQIVEDAERQTARALQQPTSALYDFEIYPTLHVPVSLPILLPAGVDSVSADDGTRVSLTDLDSLPDGRSSARLRFESTPEAGASFRIRIQASASSPAPSVRHLKNKWLDVTFSESHGIESFKFNDEVVGTNYFLNPFVTYDKRTYRATGYEFVSLRGETWDGLRRVRLKTKIPMGEFASELTYTFTLFDELPFLLVDVEARYALTPKRQVTHNMTQKLRRLMDLRWVETAPFQLTRALSAPAKNPLRVWKHNYTDITSFYDLDYSKINPKNRTLDLFNHQVTVGWVAVLNGRQGLLVGEDAQTLASMVFCPMRLREQNGMQMVSLNPFGSYYGKQFDYSHLGGNGNGTAIVQTFSGALQPNGPSFNGETLRFSLMLAPYAGDEPPQELQNAAAAHFYPLGVVVHSALPELNAVTIGDVEDFIAAEKERTALESNTTLNQPTHFLPTHPSMPWIWSGMRHPMKWSQATKSAGSLRGMWNWAR